MKFLASQFAYFLERGPTRRDLRILVRFGLLLFLLVAAYSIIFHLLMAAEGQAHSWITGLYWTLTVMTTLGFGDITFQSDAGRLFSVLVLVSGVLFLLVVLPFTFIRFFYAPWLEAQSRQRIARAVPADVRQHVILTHLDPVALSLIDRLELHGRRYFLVEPDLNRALDLYDGGTSVIVGEADATETYERLRVGDAAMVVATGDDYANTNVAFTVRERSTDVPIAAFAREADSVDVLELAGSSHVFRLTEMLGRSLARRTVAGDIRANVIGRFDDLLTVEAPVMGTRLAGHTLADARLRERTGLTVAGIWERGRFEVPRPDTRLEAGMVLVLIGTDEQLERFTQSIADEREIPQAPVVILGGGRVGRAAARALRERGVDYRIVEKERDRVRQVDAERYVIGNAADRRVLEKAGLLDASTTIVTTGDDATNIYLTIYCRKLRPRMQIISRTTLDRNISTLHRAGADFVMSYASMGSNAVFNALEHGDVVMVAEGLDIFRVPLPRRLAGVSLQESAIRETTGCSVVAVAVDGRTIANPRPDEPLPAADDAELILVGTTENERSFLARFAD